MDRQKDSPHSATSRQKLYFLVVILQLAFPTSCRDQVQQTALSCQAAQADSATTSQNLASFREGLHCAAACSILGTSAALSSAWTQQQPRYRCRSYALTVRARDTRGLNMERTIESERATREGDGFWTCHYALAAKSESGDSLCSTRRLRLRGGGSSLHHWITRLRGGSSIADSLPGLPLAHLISSPIPPPPHTRSDPPPPPPPPALISLGVSLSQLCFPLLSSPSPLPPSSPISLSSTL